MDTISFIGSLLISVLLGMLLGKIVRIAIREVRRRKNVKEKNW